jgi:hypothetical protein
MECDPPEEVRVRLTEEPRRNARHESVRPREADREGGHVLEAGALPVEYSREPPALDQDVLGRKISMIENGLTPGGALAFEELCPVVAVPLAHAHRKPWMDVPPDAGVEPFPPPECVPAVCPRDPKLHRAFTREASERLEQFRQLTLPGIGLTPGETPTRERSSLELPVDNEEESTLRISNHVLVVGNGDAQSPFELAKESGLDFDGTRHDPVSGEPSDPLSVDFEKEARPTRVDGPGSRPREIGKMLCEKAAVRRGIRYPSRSHARETGSDLLNHPPLGPLGSPSGSPHYVGTQQSALTTRGSQQRDFLSADVTGLRTEV